MGRYNNSDDSEERNERNYRELAQEIRHRMALDTAFYNLFPDIYEVDGTSSSTSHGGDRAQHDGPRHHAASAYTVPKDFDCLRFLIETFENKCLPFNEYGLGHIKYLVEYCETSATQEIVDKALDMQTVCSELHLI